MLIAGQIIKYGPALYKVEHVNECRAYIVPLTKKQIEKLDGESSNQRGVSIAANSYVQIITDLERARDEMELAAAESEIAAAKAELAERERSVTSVTPPEKSLPKAVPHRRQPVRPGGGWFIKAARPEFKAGTFAASIWTIIEEYPGLPTTDIVETAEQLGLQGAAAACVSRFHQAGLIEKR